ncbi:MAG TPA: cysteine--tRNA ligase [Candidatus Paceibacterota bacterium]
MEINLHNTLTNKKEKFESLEKGAVKMYNCGPTVYGRQHIGNLSMFVFADILRRTLEYSGLKVKQVINFTDFGHLSGDNDGQADEGEDRMSKGLKREGFALTLENMRKLAEKYANIFLSDLKLLNIDPEKIIFPYASDYIEEQINLIKILEEKGFAYSGEQGVYFDTKKFPNYGKLGNINLEGLEEGARVSKTEKRNPTDFILWKSDKKLGWESPWGLGFPGWHIECSAMIIKILGEQIDIHTGGIEHIGVHHNNEIAQSEAATGTSPFSKFWLHREHIKIDDMKISKSEGTAFYMDDLLKHKIHPLSFRYWLLTSHYKTPANFTWEGVLGAQNAYEKILSSFKELPEESGNDGEIVSGFEEAISDDLNTPKVMALLQDAKSKYAISKIDSVLGLKIETLSKEIFENIPDEILELKKERDDARSRKDWQRSDELRVEIEKEGYILEDKIESGTIRRVLASIN